MKRIFITDIQEKVRLLPYWKIVKNKSKTNKINAG